MEKIYFCIDLKSFYASVECAERGIDPFNSNLVVADSTRGDGTVCLAVSPAMKKLGVKNRCRIFEIPKNIKYIKARPRMKLYMEKSAEIYGIYLKYFDKNDIHIYSIDECFIDVTSYLALYNMNPIKLCEKIMHDILKQTKIPASAGIGTNLFLAKVALDILAKHNKNSIAILDENLFKIKLWHHRPLTDFWNVGENTCKRLEKLGIFDMCCLSQTNEELLYKNFGANAEFLIDHSKGIEPCTMADIKAYRGKNHSIGTSQILFEDYDFQKAKIVLVEMCENLVLDLTKKELITNCISIHVGYSKNQNLKSTGKEKTLSGYTNSFDKIKKAVISLFEETTLKDAKIRKLSISFHNLIKDEFLSYSFLDDKNKLQRENKMQKAIIDIKEKHGKNAILNGISHLSGATAKIRNIQVGGHHE